MVVESYSSRPPPIPITHPVTILSPPMRRPWMDLLAAIAVVGLLAIGVWSSYWADLRNDQYQLIQLGQNVYHGGRMYVDAWENKPPGIAWISALGFVAAGGQQIGAWIMPGVVGLACIMALWIGVARSLSFTAGRRAALLAALLCSFRLYDASSVNPDSYSAMFELAACAMWLLAVSAARGWGGAGVAVLAGLLWAAATSMKQVGCVGLIAVTLATVIAAVTSFADRRRWLAVMALTWFGFLLGAGAIAALLYRQGTLPAAWHAIYSFNRAFLPTDVAGQVLHAWPRIRSDVGVLAMPMWLAAFAAVATLFAGRSKGASAALIGALALWLTAAAFLALVGPSHTMRYWQGIFPPLVILAATGLFHLEEMYRRLERGYRVALVVLSASAMITMGRPLFQTYRLGVAGSHVAYDSESNERRRFEKLGARLAELIPADERMYVWAYQSGLYVHADRRPASRFTYPRSADQMREILSDLEQNRPFALLVPQDAAAEFEKWCDEDCHWRRAQLMAGYVQGDSLDGFQFWQRGGVATASQ